MITEKEIEQAAAKFYPYDESNKHNGPIHWEKHTNKIDKYRSSFTTGANFVLNKIDKPIIVNQESTLTKEQKEEFFRLLGEMNSKGQFTIIDVKYTQEDMDSEMCLFAEWRDEQITGSWIDEDNVKKYRTRDKHGRVKYLSIPELLQIYKNRAK